MKMDDGFGVTFDDITSDCSVTKDTAFYTTTSRFVAWFGAFSQERQGLWLLKDDLARTHPHGHHPRLYSSATSTMVFSPNTPTTFKLRTVEIPIDSGIDLSITIDKVWVFINKTLSTESLINQLLVKRVVLSISIDCR